MLGIPKHEEPPSTPQRPLSAMGEACSRMDLTPQRPLSAMGEACSRMDLTAIHQILFATHYKDDEGTNEVTNGFSGFKLLILFKQ